MTGTAALNAATSLGARVSGMIVGIALTPFVLHGIGRDLYGISAAAGSVLEYLWLLRGGLGTGMRRYVTVHFHAGERELANRYYAAGFWWASLLRLLVVGTGIALARLLCVFMKVEPNLMTDAVGGLVLIFLSAGAMDVGAIFEVPIYVTGHTSRISIVRIAGALLRVGFIVPAFLLFVPSLRVYAAAALLAEITSTAILAWVAARERVVPHVVPKPDFGVREVRNALFSFSGLSLLSQVAAILYLATDNLLIGRFYGPARVTEYSLGTRWAPMIQGFLWAGVSALTPLLTQMEAKGDLERTRAVVVRAARVITAFAVPMCLVPCVLGDVFLTRWVGAEYAHCVHYMWAMLLPMLVGFPLEPLWMAMMARGKIGWIAFGDVVAAVLNPFVSLLLALQFGLGPLGFALGNTLAILARNLVLRPLMNRGEEALPPMRQALAALPPALAGGAPALLLLWFLKPWYGGSFATVVGAGAIGGLLCLTGTTLATVGVADTRKLAGSLLARVRGRA
ncbi:MAG: MATE family efflux transporter [Candidatus Eisenbacteria bacterium]|nr:MATE family efflux transporter [Candidatus Eisenbacteria bacterium]